ncbi:hypothetical protein ACWEO2_17875 [Nocardia sp. NPDC004278]
MFTGQSGTDGRQHTAVVDIVAFIELVGGYRTVVGREIHKGHSLHSDTGANCRAHHNVGADDRIAFNHDH